MDLEGGCGIVAAWSIDHTLLGAGETLMRIRDNMTTGNTSPRVGIWGISIPLPFAAATESTRVLPVEDDPAILARLDAIMSDHIEPCSRCGRDPHVCEAIGCDPDDRPLLAARNA
jgi:hypothetical protein